MVAVEVKMELLLLKVLQEEPLELREQPMV
jgi:hypothetical protein